MHDGALLLAQAIQGATNALDQAFELLGHQLDRHEQLGQGEHLGDALLAVATVLFQGLERDVQLLGDRTETLASHFWIGTALGLFLVVAGFGVFVVVIVLVVGFVGFFDRRRYFGRRRNAVIRVDVATQNVGQAAAFAGNPVIFAENMVDCAREVRDCAHHFTNALFDPLGDFDFAFTGQKLDSTHFAHVHAHRVRRAADVGFHCRQRCGCFFGGCFVGVGFGQQKSIRIRSTLEYVDPHVVDHADDVFHLLRI
ncbi:hypothetical protein D9M71_239840 [compost metagenome]